MVEPCAYCHRPADGRDVGRPVCGRTACHVAHGWWRRGVAEARPVLVAAFARKAPGAPAWLLWQPDRPPNAWQARRDATTNEAEG